jgi:hypothetical protein
MILVGRMTANEREILHAALKAYDVEQSARARASKVRAIHDDVRWRRFVVAELLEQIGNG